AARRNSVPPLRRDDADNPIPRSLVLGLAESLATLRDVLVGFIPIVGSVNQIWKEGLNFKTGTMLALDIGLTLLAVGSALKGVASAAFRSRRLLNIPRHTQAHAIAITNRVGKWITYGAGS